MTEENKEKTKELPAELIIYRLGELSGQIAGLKSDIAKVNEKMDSNGKTGCFYGQKSQMEVEQIKKDIENLKKKPRETIIFLSIILGVILTICGILAYFNSALGGNRSLKSVCNIEKVQ